MKRSVALNKFEIRLILLLVDSLIVMWVIYLLINFVLRGNFNLNNYQIIIYLLGLLLYYFISYALDLFNLERVSRVKSIFPLSFVSSMIFTISLFLGVIVFINTTVSRFYLFIFLFSTPMAISLWRFFAAKTFVYKTFVKQAAYIYDCEETKKNSLSLIKSNEDVTGYRVKLTLDAKDRRVFIKRKVLNSLNKVNAIILNLKDSKNLTEEVERFIIDSMMRGLEFQTFESFYESSNEAIFIDLESNNLYDLMELRNHKIRYINDLFSFSLNLLLVFFVGIIFTFFIPIVFILNIFFNRGPLFYSQKRVGKGGREFNIYKFRSMVTDAEKSGVKMATINDSRITIFGKIMRKFRIDELPQIISIIKGDMAFIGPRPERKIFVDELIKITPFYNIRHLVKPGITGWAQVNYKYGENLDDSIKKLEYDLFYIKNKSITLDIRVFFKTITTVIFSRGV